MYELIVEGEKRYLKKSTLTNLDVTHEKLRMLVHLAYELGYFRFKDCSDSKDPKLEMYRYLSISRLVDELGKMIGSWIKKVKLEKNNWM
jgi:hypothetical protein